MDEGLAVIIAAILAIAGIFYTSRQQRKMLRKQHTFQVIEKLSGWTELDACNTHAAKLAKCGKMPSLGNDLIVRTARNSTSYSTTMRCWPLPSSAATSMKI